MRQRILSGQADQNTIQMLAQLGQEMRAQEAPAGSSSSGRGTRASFLEQSGLSSARGGPGPPSLMGMTSLGGVHGFGVQSLVGQSSQGMTELQRVDQLAQRQHQQNLAQHQAQLQHLRRQQESRDVGNIPSLTSSQANQIAELQAAGLDLRDAQVAVLEAEQQERLRQQAQLKEQQQVQLREQLQLQQGSQLTAQLRQQQEAQLRELQLQQEAQITEQLKLQKQRQLQQEVQLQGVQQDALMRNQLRLQQQAQLGDVQQEAQLRNQLRLQQEAQLREMQEAQRRELLQQQQEAFLRQQLLSQETQLQSQLQAQHHSYQDIPGPSSSYREDRSSSTARDSRKRGHPYEEEQGERRDEGTSSKQRRQDSEEKVRRHFCEFSLNCLLLVTFFQVCK